MPTIVQEVKLILSDVTANNNKFWTGTLNDDSSVECTWGRVGKKAQSNYKSFGSQYAAEAFLEKKRSEKVRKGYSPLKTVGKVESQAVSDKKELKSIAREQIKSSSSSNVVIKLIDYLTEKNAHQITKATGGQITMNAQGLMQTPMGLVEQEAIDEANTVLDKIGALVGKDDYGHSMKQLTNTFLRLIPQDIGMGRLNVRNFWANIQSVQKQKALVDSLQASLLTAQTTAKTDDKDDQPKEKIFDVEMELVTDTSVIDRIKKKFNKTRKSMHASNHLKVKKVYSIVIKSEKEVFEKKGSKIGNVKELWHGTRVSNVLAILKAGLKIPPRSSSNVTGRMFGDGLYFSDQSTKSLNYAYGYWGGSRDNNCFMFLADVAMGKEHTPSSYGGKLPKAGYDSTFAKAGQSGVHNNEMIVYNTNQATLKYLVEFSN
jgi:poly [ADP-ribose] polymerase